MIENIHLLKTLLPFEKHLIEMFPRVRLHKVGDDYDKDFFMGYAIRHGVIHFSTLMPSLSHEIAHMVEMKTEKRWIQNDWGFSLDLNHTWMPILIRETRVRAIQAHMNRQRQIYENEFVFDNVKYPLTKFKSRPELVEYLQAMSERTQKAWSPDRIEHEWKIRVAYIRNHMETKKEVNHGQGSLR